MGAALGPSAEELPELAGVAWRERVDERSLARIDRRWTAWVVAHEIPFLATAVGLPLLSLLTLPVSVAALAFAWFIPSLYAARGAGVLRPLWTRGAAGAGSLVSSGAGSLVSSGAGSVGSSGPEARALGLLGDLLGHDARALVSATGFVVEPGSLGTWVIGPAGALLVRPGGHRVCCWCVRVTGDELPRADRVAHLLLALRADESGFATVANLSFSGARWRVRRALRWPGTREALDAATTLSRAQSRSGRGSVPAAV